MIEGVPKFNALVILEISSINFTESAPALVAHAAFVDTKTGKTYGKTTGRNWSEETLAAVAALRLAMERDLASVVFGEDSTATSPRDVGGIGESVAHEAPPL